MPDGPDFAIFVLLSVPGILGVWFWSSFSPSPKLPADDRLLRLIILSLISYSTLGVASAVGLSYFSPDALYSSTKTIEDAFSWSSLKIVFFATLVSLGYSAISIKQTEHEWVHKLARKFKFTYKHGYSSHWDTVVHGPLKGSWVSVKFSNDEEYIGYIKDYSECTEERSFSLASVGKYKKSGEIVWWPSEHLLWVPDISVVRSIRVNPSTKGNNHAEREQPTVIPTELFAKSEST